MKLTTYRCNLCGVIRKEDDMQQIGEDIHICHYCENKPLPEVSLRI